MILTVCLTGCSLSLIHIYTCCNIKKLTVERDEKDKGERMLLNFGHTLGHAIEPVSYTHLDVYKSQS